MIDMVPIRVTLSILEKRNNETFKEYIRRWREVAARVKPALESGKFSSFFICTLQSPYYDKLLMLSGDKFANVVRKGELLEGEIKAGRVEDSSSSKKSFPVKKKEGETHEITFHQSNQNRPRGPRPVPIPVPANLSIPKPVPTKHPVITTTKPTPTCLLITSTTYPIQYHRHCIHPTFPTTTTKPKPNTRKEPRPPKQFTPLPIPYSKICPLLYERHLVSPIFAILSNHLTRNGIILIFTVIIIMVL
ncbi:hypothetical protein PTKIN_Ptkin02bG0117900 [Pterospermum kingtungense]